MGRYAYALEAEGLGKAYRMFPGPLKRIAEALTLGRYRGMAHPVRVGPEPPTPLPAPALGQHSREILLSLGYSDEEVARLGREGAVIGLGGRATG